MAIGERTPLALLDAAAAARMAVGEAITNLCAAPVESLARIKLSANWMAAAGHPGEDALLFDAVKAVGMELCPELELSIPVGKDSLSMQAQWHNDGAAHKSVSPVSLIVSAFAPVPTCARNSRRCSSREEESELWLIGLGAGKQRLGGSVLAQCFPRPMATVQLPAFAGRRARSRRSAAPARFLRTDPRRARGRPAARLPRPLRRRRVRRAVRNGVLLARGPGHQPRRLGRRCARSARCSTRNSAPSCRSRPKTAPSSPTWSRATA